MRAALVAEYRKLATTRLWWVLLIAMAGYLAFVSAAVAGTFAFAPEDATGLPRGADAARSVYSLVNGIGYVFPLVIGSLAMTGEFRHRTITQSLLLDPDRTRFLLAKLIAVVPVGLLAGLAGTAGVLVGGAPLLAWKGDGARLGEGEVLVGILLGIVVVALWAMIGVAVGSVLSNQVAAIVVILAFTQLVEPIIRVALSQVDSLAGAASYLPGGAADSLIGASFLSTTGSVDLLPRGVAAVVLVAYVVVLAVVGRLTTLRRDIA